MAPDPTYSNISSTRRVRGVADVVFLIDATGSMKPCIDAVKNSIDVFIDNVTNPAVAGKFIIRDLRISICGYRDYIYEPSLGKKALEVTPFTRNRHEVRAALNALQAEGGDDIPESLLDALLDIINWEKSEKGAPEEPGKWRARYEALRAIYVFTDAPYHPTTVGGKNFLDVGNLLMKQGVRIIVISPRHDCYEDLCSFNRCKWVDITEDSGMEPEDAMRAYAEDPERMKETMRFLAQSTFDYAIGERCDDDCR